MKKNADPFCQIDFRFQRKKSMAFMESESNAIYVKCQFVICLRCVNACDTFFDGFPLALRFSFHKFSSIQLNCFQSIEFIISFMLLDKFVHHFFTCFPSLAIAGAHGCSSHTPCVYLRHSEDVVHAWWRICSAH